MADERCIGSPQRPALLGARSADADRPDPAPESTGLPALSNGLSLNVEDEHEILRHGMLVADILYACCADKQAAAFQRATR